MPFCGLYNGKDAHIAVPIGTKLCINLRIDLGMVVTEYVYQQCTGGDINILWIHGVNI